MHSIIGATADHATLGNITLSLATLSATIMTATMLMSAACSVDALTLRSVMLGATTSANAMLYRSDIIVVVATVEFDSIGAINIIVVLVVTIISAHITHMLGVA